MVDRTKDESVMRDITQDAIYEALQECNPNSEYIDQGDLDKFERLLAEQGFMIVPIEDPTDFFGVTEDSL